MTREIAVAEGARAPLRLVEIEIEIEIDEMDELIGATEQHARRCGRGHAQGHARGLSPPRLIARGRSALDGGDAKVR